MWHVSLWAKRPHAKLTAVVISVTGAHWVTAQDTNEDRVMPIALHCMEKHECMMHISCVVFEDKCHFRKTKQIRPPVHGVESRIRLARRSRAGPARSLKTHPSRTSQFGPRTKLACFSARGRGRRAGTTPRASSRTSQETQERRVQVSPSGTMRER